jgi:hypothetical protein
MKNRHRKRVSRYDIGILLRSIIAAIDADTYATTRNFRTVVDSVVTSYLRGRNVRITLTAILETINEITEYSLKNEDKPALWWRRWISRSASQLRDRQASTGPRLRRLPVRRLPLGLRPDTYTITTDVELLVTGIGQEVAVLGDRGRFQIFTTPDEAREFGVGLLSALNKLEMDLGVIEMDPVPFDYADTATTDWEETVRWSIT